jgi:hypothetical protein
MQVVSQVVPADHFAVQFGPQLSAEHFDAAAIVTLDQAGNNGNEGFWSRFAMRDSVGAWAMDFMHTLTGFGDLFGNIGFFDEMACGCGTHPSAFTKAAIGWLDGTAIAGHTARTANYDLHALGLLQPPPTGRVAAVRIGSTVPYLMVEARQRVDQFDANIPSEGVIVYRVQTSDPHGHPQNGAPIHLLTTTALTPGQAFTSDTHVKIQVIKALPGGFSIGVDDPLGTDPLKAVVPDVVGLLPALAAKQVRTAGLVPSFTGPPSTHQSFVFKQTPKAGEVVNKGSTVTMTLHAGPVP